MWTHQRQYESERNMSTKNEETYFATWSDFYHASCPKKREAFTSLALEPATLFLPAIVEVNDNVPALIAALREANALSQARNVEMERALKQSRENNEVALEWQRRYELETIICERVMAERDKAESALREAIAKIEKLLQLRPNVGVKKEK